MGEADITICPAIKNPVICGFLRTQLTPYIDYMFPTLWNKPSKHTVLSKFLKPWIVFSFYEFLPKNYSLFSVPSHSNLQIFSRNQRDSTRVKALSLHVADQVQHPILQIVPRAPYKWFLSTTSRISPTPSWVCKTPPKNAKSKRFD